MNVDEWVVTLTEHLASGNVRVSGIHATEGPFRVTITAEQYATRGVHEAVRTFYEHHPARLRER